MSMWLRLVREIKRRSPQDLFTTSQRQVYESLASTCQLPHARTNLIGPHGVGKTLVAWGLAQAYGMAHLTSVDALLDRQAGQLTGFTRVIVDNAPRNESDLRRIVATLDMLNIESIIFITTEPADLRMRHYELPNPTDDDIEIVVRTLARLGFYKHHPLPEHPNYWQVLQACV